MRSKHIYILILALSLLASYSRVSLGVEPEEAVQAAVEEGRSPKKSDLSFGLDLDFNSRYLWRGIYYGNGPVWQPYAWISKWGITPSVWSNFVLGNETDQGKFNEVDLTLAYQNKIGDLTIRPWFIYYLYPYTSSVPSTGEVALSLAYQLGPFSLFTDQIFDVKQFKGAYYADLGVKYARELNAFMTFEGSVSTAWASSKFNNAYFYVSKTALDNVNFNVALAAKAFSFITVRPHLQYTVLTNTSLRDSFNEPNLFCIGVTVGASY